MTDFIDFKNFIKNNFEHALMSYDDFKGDVKFIDIDLFPSENFYLTINLLPDFIQIATCNRKPELDFSLYDYLFKNADNAKAFLLKLKDKKKYPFVKNSVKDF